MIRFLDFEASLLGRDSFLIEVAWMDGNERCGSDAAPYDPPCPAERGGHVADMAGRRGRGGAARRGEGVAIRDHPIPSGAARGGKPVAACHAAGTGLATSRGQSPGSLRGTGRTTGAWSRSVVPVWARQGDMRPDGGSALATPGSSRRRSSRACIPNCGGTWLARRGRGGWAVYGTDGTATTTTTGSLP